MVSYFKLSLSLFPPLLPDLLAILFFFQTLPRLLMLMHMGKRAFLLLKGPYPRMQMLFATSQHPLQGQCLPCVTGMMHFNVCAPAHHLNVIHGVVFYNLYRQQALWPRELLSAVTVSLENVCCMKGPLLIQWATKIWPTLIRLLSDTDPGVLSGVQKVMLSSAKYSSH